MRNWLEVDLNKLAYNIDTVREALPDECKIIAVVKANAYGHGEAKICRALTDLGINKFAVASLGEGINIREAGVEGDILVLSYVDPEDLPEAAAYGITVAAISEEYAKTASEVAVKKDIPLMMHLKLNTGMNRVGFDCRNADDLNKIKAAYELPGIVFSGIFSHFSSSDDLSEGADEYTLMQLERFNTVLDYLEEQGIDPGLRHISNSGAIGKFPQARFDAVRCGALMYGYNTAFDAPMDVKPIAAWKATVSCVRTLQAGDAVSYSRHYIAKGGEKLATLCVGYADGYKRILAGKEDGPHAWVFLNGVRCPIVGNICMDQMMIDATGVDVKQGDIAILMDESLTADELGEWASSCMHDIIANIGPRVDRIYID